MTYRKFVRLVRENLNSGDFGPVDVDAMSDSQAVAYWVDDFRFTDAELVEIVGQCRDLGEVCEELDSQLIPVWEREAAA